MRFYKNGPSPHLRGISFHFLGFKSCLLEKAGELSILQTGQPCIPVTGSNHTSWSCFILFSCYFSNVSWSDFKLICLLTFKTSPTSLQRQEEESGLALQCCQMYEVLNHWKQVITWPWVCLGTNEQGKNRCDEIQTFVYFWYKPVYEHLYFDVWPPDHMGIDYRLLLRSFGLKLSKQLLFLIKLKLCQLACISREQNKMKWKCH